MENSLLGLNTERLVLRQLVEDDADFLVQLMNDPDWLAYIGDRNVKTREAALQHIHEAPHKMYIEKQFGMLMVIRKDTGARIGLAGILSRREFQEPDLGYGFVPAGRGAGFAYEATSALMKVAKESGRFSVLRGLVHPGNKASRALLEKLGFTLMSPQPACPWENTLIYENRLKSSENE
ncbi:GNAT family N-acetyltransferase [Paraneptunicella aestuarii]|uniref:GNAT family N-acetyltransferase n=1 Tax=Paraneptunicella aestuarii TaxID=2831148 RepID=UPI001E43102D|nr:GNAT family N-acetyltransferase [Paraneptunicella aestuarii]UAA38930.1 GNAT family N-acetyltransferase [Paraneptunicella aestuarii]